MITGQLAKDYQEQLTAEHETVEQYLAILKEESELLSQTMVPFRELTDLTEAKKHCAEVMTKMVADRRDLAGQFDGAADIDYVHIAAEMGCTEAWQALVGLYAEAESSNTRNGIAIQNRLDYTDRAVKFLRKQTAQGLYMSDGLYNDHASGGRINRGA